MHLYFTRNLETVRFKHFSRDIQMAPRRKQTCILVVTYRRHRPGNPPELSSWCCSVSMFSSPVSQTSSCARCFDRATSCAGVRWLRLVALLQSLSLLPLAPRPRPRDPLTAPPPRPASPSDTTPEQHQWLVTNKTFRNKLIYKN